MRADWIEIKRGDISPQCAGIYVTMNPKGNIVLSRVTYEMLGEPRAFLLLYDKANNRIGLQPTTLSTRNAYPATISNGKGKKIHAHRLVREHRIDLPQTVRFYEAEIDPDGVLILDLRTAKISPRAVGWKKRRKLGAPVSASA